MVQGTTSDAGKSVLVAGLCRVLANRGVRVAPFKPQNMALNSAVTENGGEIGRAQALQAQACFLNPHTDMNPILLKPSSDTGAQVIVHGQAITHMDAVKYHDYKKVAIDAVMESHQRLTEQYQVVVVEGAGSPAEINLRANDIANMGFAEAANVPVVLIGDIDRGGVIAQMVGTHVVLSSEDRDRITGFAINKFRGDVTLFDDGITAIRQGTGWRNLGVLPWFADAWKLPAEDVMDIATRPGGEIKIAVPRLGRIANFDDLDPLVAEPNVTVDIIEQGQPLPGDAALIILPGSKSTINDLENFRANSWDIDLKAHHRRGGKIFGICGGYQMLGRKIHDPEGIEGAPCSAEGLGYLDIETTMTPKKNISLTTAHTVANRTPVHGYEIHLGETSGPDCQNPWLRLADRPEGAMSPDQRVRGCYLHGLFTSDGFRKEVLADLGTSSQLTSYDTTVHETLDKLAVFVERHMDVDGLLSLAGEIEL